MLANKSSLRFLTAVLLFIIEFSNKAASKSIEEIEPSDYWEKEYLFQPFGSLHTLQKLTFWAAKEEKIYKALNLRRTKIREEIRLLSRYITDYTQTSGYALAETKFPIDTFWNRGSLIGANAILAHQMTDRYANMVLDLREHINSSGSRHAFENLNQVLDLQNAHPELQWPNSDDLYVSHLALVEIQNIYGTDADALFHGPQYDTKFGGTLQPIHCAHLGMFSQRVWHYYRAIEWFEFTQTHVEMKTMSDHSFLSEDFLRISLCIAIQQHNKKRYEAVKNGTVPTKDSIQFFGNPVRIGESSSSRWHVRDMVIQKFGYSYSNYTNDLANMRVLCMGKEFQPVKIKSRLRCFFEKERHPYFTLNPLKTEQLSEYPYIVQLYDILSNQTINEIYEQRGELHVSQTLGGPEDEPIHDSLLVRSSAGTFLNWDLIYKIQNISERVTGLLLTDMLEGVQHVEYTYGRFYSTHVDPITFPFNPINFTEVDLKKYGDRIATLLYYMDEPQAGGSTPFTQLGINAHPVKGSAVFWINMFKNGSIRGDVRHSSCPVLHGSKTILNQWFRYNANFQTFKCSINQDE